MKTRATPFALRLLIQLLALLSLFVATTAHAQEDRATTEAARRKFQEGVRYFDSGQYPKAQAAFAQAYELKKHPSVLLNLAQSELRTPGFETHAAQHFSEYLRDTTDTKTRTEAEKGLSAAKQKVGVLVIQADQDGAEVLVDGKPYGTTPLPDPIFLKPGTYRVEVRKDGSSKGGTVVAAAGQTQTIVAKLSKPAPPPPAPTTTAPSDQSVEERGKREPFFRWMSHSPAGLILGASAVLGAAGTGTLYVLADQSFDDATKQKNAIDAYAFADPNVPDVGVCDFVNPSQEIVNAYWLPCKNYESLREDGENYRLGMYAAAGITGVALLALPVAYFIETAPGRKARRDKAVSSVELRITPTIGPVTQGIGVSGRF